jgi:hypothetical protein
MMAAITIVTGAVLTAIGWYVFDATNREHVTALIPAFLGLALVLLGGLSFKEGLRKHTMHAAAALASLGFLAFTGRGAPSWPVALGLVNGTVSKEAAYGTLSSAVVCLVFVLLCVNSFVQARKRRRQAEAAAGASETAPKPAT